MSCMPLSGNIFHIYGEGLLMGTFRCPVHQVERQASLYTDHGRNSSRTLGRAHGRRGGYGANDPARDVPRLRDRREGAFSSPGTHPYQASIGIIKLQPCASETWSSCAALCSFHTKMAFRRLPGARAIVQLHLLASKLQASPDTISNPTGSTVHLSVLVESVIARKPPAKSFPLRDTVCHSLSG